MANVNSKKELIDTKEENLEVKENTLEKNNEKPKETAEERRARVRAELDNAVKHSENKFLKVIEVYHYLNENGENYLRVLRNDGIPKFMIQHYENGEWVKGAGDKPRVPYHLPELIKAKESNKSAIFITQGERDADTINNADERFLATTAMTKSANKWDYSFNDYISKSTKVIILQNDTEAGQKFADKTKKTLQYGCKSCIFEVKTIKKIFDIDDSMVTDITDIKERVPDDEFIEMLEMLEESALRK